jgi:hypothetical protein
MTMNTTRGIGYYPTTWDWQNHPLALALYREQAAGRLDFAGVIWSAFLTRRITRRKSSPTMQRAWRRV